MSPFPWDVAIGCGLGAVIWLVLIGPSIYLMLRLPWPCWASTTAFGAWMVVSLPTAVWLGLSALNKVFS